MADSPVDFRPRLNNCYIVTRKGDGPLFYSDGESIHVSLDGYAIVPIEQYREMRPPKKRKTKRAWDGR
jgi:hypothetical protein